MFRQSIPAIASVSVVLFSTACEPRLSKEQPAAAAPAAITAAKASPQAPSSVERGAFLVRMGGCGDCHTPMKFDPAIGMPVPERDRFLSGHPVGAPAPTAEPKGHDQAVMGPTFTSFRLPFGTVFAANLTSDPETGLGRWTEDMFVRAMRTGRHMGATGRPIAPPMPWMTLQQQSDDDLKAIFAYLQSVPAIKNAVPQPDIPGQVLDGIAASYDKVLAAMAASPDRTNVAAR
jgi:cytochrome c553